MVSTTHPVTPRATAEWGAHVTEAGDQTDTVVVLRSPMTTDAQWRQLGATIDQLLAAPTDVVDAVAHLLAAAALAGRDIGDVLGAACTEATRRLPRGMALTHARPGSWEASHVDALTHPDAVAEGPGPTPLEVECPRCNAPAGQGCWNPRTYADIKHPHRERLQLAREANHFDPVYGWSSW